MVEASQAQTTAPPVEEQAGPRDEYVVGEVKELVEALRSALVDLRAAISELTNPFNVMRRYGEMVELEALRKASEGVSEASQPAPLSSSTAMSSEPESATAERRSFNEAAEVVERVLRGEGLPIKETKARAYGFPDLIKMVRMLYALRERMPSDLLGKYVEVLSAMGLLGEKEASVVKKLLDVIDDGLEKGLTVEDQILALHVLTKALGVSDERLEEEVMRILLTRVGGSRGSS